MCTLRIEYFGAILGGYENEKAYKIYIYRRLNELSNKFADFVRVQTPKVWRKRPKPFNKKPIFARFMNGLL